MIRIKNSLLWLSRRAYVVITLLLFAAMSILLWFLITGSLSSESTLALAITAISTFFAAISSFATLLQAVETQRQRENLERPHVLTYFDVRNSGAIYFVIENFGNAPAKNIHIKFEPIPVDYENRPFTELSLFTNSIPFLASGKSLRQFTDSGAKFLNRKNLEFTITVSYASIDGRLFEEQDNFDLTYMKDNTVPSRSIEENLKIISDDLHSLVKRVNSISNSDSLLVETPKEYRLRIQELFDNARQENADQE